MLSALPGVMLTTAPILAGKALRHLDQLDSLERTKRTFRVERYRRWQGYRRFTPINIERAYRDLQKTVLNAD